MHRNLNLPETTAKEEISSGLNKYYPQEVKTQREDIPEDSIASLQEELAASKLREAESNLALKDLRSKVGELNSMWLKHIKTSESNSATPAEMPSTPKKVLLLILAKTFLSMIKHFL